LAIANCMSFFFAIGRRHRMALGVTLGEPWLPILPKVNPVPCCGDANCEKKSHVQINVKILFDQLDVAFLGYNLALFPVPREEKPTMMLKSDEDTDEMYGREGREIMKDKEDKEGEGAQDEEQEEEVKKTRRRLNVQRKRR